MSDSTWPIFIKTQITPRSVSLRKKLFRPHTILPETILTTSGVIDVKLAYHGLLKVSFRGRHFMKLLSLEVSVGEQFHKTFPSLEVRFMELFHETHP